MALDGHGRFDDRHAANYLAAACSVISAVNPQEVARGIKLLESTRAAGGTVWTFGNGGNATIAAHLSLGLTLNARRTGGTPIRSGCLSASAAALTAAMNDFGAEQMFSSQLEVEGRPGDTVVAFSVSGSSPNVIAGVETAKRLGLAVVAIVGDGRSPVATLSDHIIDLRCSDPALAEDAAQAVAHAIYCWFMKPPAERVTGAPSHQTLNTSGHRHGWLGEGVPSEARRTGDLGVALVTGGGRGIGAATSRRLARTGWIVCLTYLRDSAAANAVVDDIVRSGGRAQAVQADVGDEPSVRAAFARADTMGRLSALVANAGIVAPVARVDSMEADRVRRILQVNVVGAILCCREAVRRMSLVHGGQGGSIVLVSSAASRIGSPGEYVDYAASKGAVDTLGIGLAKEVSSEGIRVNIVRPGMIDTEIHASGGQPDRVARLGPTFPMGRAGTSEEVASAIHWLVTDATYCTGTFVDVAGGR